MAKGAVSVGKLRFKTGTKADVETTVKLPHCFDQKNLDQVIHAALNHLKYPIQ